MSPPLAPIAILGCGVVGTALARALGAKGHRLVLWSRDPGRRRSAARRARQAGAEEVAVVARPEEALARSHLVLLCVPEPALPSLALQLGRAETHAQKRRTFLCVSGVMPLPLLRRSFRAQGVCGRLHPLCPVLARDTGGFEGLPFGLEGPPSVVREARRLVASLGGTALLLSGRSPERYHAGAALLGGGLVALFDLAERCMGDSVRSPRALRAALRAFALRNVENVERYGAIAALTGPIARGARANVASNLRALGRTPRGRETYRALGRSMLALAAKKRGAERARLASVRALLRP